MSTNAINGKSDKFKIWIVYPSNEVVSCDFTGKHQALTEYDETISTRHELLKGGKVKKPKYVNLEWEIDFSEFINKTDAKFINRIKNAEFDNAKIYLMPHLDAVNRYFRVLVIENKRALTKHYGNQEAKGYVIAFENADAQEQHRWVDADDIPVITNVNNESIKFII